MSQATSLLVQYKPGNVNEALTCMHLLYKVRTMAKDRCMLRPTIVLPFPLYLGNNKAKTLRRL